ncbi:hypothetical protein PO185_08420 [Limosilactobacillus mucosae]|nr:hypothetical protein [Limosilactobacillus mucosae]MDC2845666.1 hypothetical protein [Limosilactobacillus mucosae]
MVATFQRLPIRTGLNDGRDFSTAAGLRKSNDGLEFSTVAGPHKS